MKTLSSARLRSDGPIVRARLHAPCADEPCRFVEGDALIDTGAHMSHVDSSAVARLGLKPSGYVGINGVAGSARQPTYKAQLSFPDESMPKMDLESIASSDSIGKLGIMILIGRDVLADANLVYLGGEGRFGIAPIGDQDLVAVSASPMSTTGALLASGIGLAVVAGLLVWWLKPAPECPPCALPGAVK